MKQRAFLLLLIWSAQAFAIVETPELHSPVTDTTRTLGPSETNALVSQLNEFERTSSTQIVVLIIPSLEGGEIRDYAIHVVEKNKIGQKGKNNGALLLIAKLDRKLSIEVGYGLEGVLPDAICDSIIRNVIRPRFRTGDFYGGIEAGIRAIMAATKGEYKADTKAGAVNLGLVLLLLIFMFFFLLFFWGGPPLWISSGGWGGGYGGGGGSGWSGGGGGWSGGGGSFGGGGASGGW